MLKLFISDLKMMLRNRQALVWSILFPVIFIIIFGLFFGSNTNNTSGSISIINQSSSELSKTIEKTLSDSKVFTIKSADNLDAAKDQIKQGKLSAVVYLPETFGQQTPDMTNKVLIYSDPANVQVQQVLSSFINQILTQASFQIQKAKPLFEVEVSEINDKDHAFSYFDFILCGILGMALMNGSIIGIAVGISRYREDKILKRITSTPVKPWKFIVAEVLSRLLLNLLQVLLILTVGIFVFHGHIYGNIFLVILLAMLGGVLFQLLGFVLASFAKTADAAQSMSQAVTIPMMFLAGIFFPIDSLPKWLSSIVQYLPLAPLLRMIREVSIDAISPLTNPINMITVCGWILIALVISIWKFRLSDE